MGFDTKDNKGLDELPDTEKDPSNNGNPGGNNDGGLPSPSGGDSGDQGADNSGGGLPSPSEGGSGDQGKGKLPDGDEEDPTPQGSPEVQEAIENLGPEEKEEPKFFETVGNDFKNFGGRIGNKLNRAKEFGGKIRDRDSRRELLAQGKKKAIRGIRRNAIAAWKAAPSAGLNALKTAGRIGGALTLGAVAGVAGAALTGDAEQSLGMAFAGAAGGNALTGKALNSTVGRANNNKSTREAFGAAKYGSRQDYINAKSDKAHLKSEEHNDEYEKYFKNGKYAMSKKKFDEATLSYRQAGITDTKTIRKALHLEAEYAKNDKDAEKVRKKVQNIAQSYDAIDRKAVYGSDDKATQATLKNIEGQLEKGDAKQKRRVANEILQGYRDWYNTP